MCFNTFAVLALKIMHMKRKINVFTLLILMYSIVICSVFEREAPIVDVSRRNKTVPEISTTTLSSGETHAKTHNNTQALVSRRNGN